MRDRSTIEDGRMISSSFSFPFLLLPSRGNDYKEFFFSSCPWLVDSCSDDWLIDWYQWEVRRSKCIKVIDFVDRKWGLLFLWNQNNIYVIECWFQEYLQIRFLGLFCFGFRIVLYSCSLLSSNGNPMPKHFVFFIGGSESFPCVAVFISGQLLRNVYISCYESKTCFFFFVTST